MSGASIKGLLQDVGSQSVSSKWARLDTLCGCLLLCTCRVFGFWLALTFSTALQAAAFGLLIARFDWGAEVQRAAAMLRAARQARESSDS